MKKRYIFEVTGHKEIVAYDEDSARAELAYYDPRDYTYDEPQLVDVKDA